MKNELSHAYRHQERYEEAEPMHLDAAAHPHINVPQIPTQISKSHGPKDPQHPRSCASQTRPLGSRHQKLTQAYKTRPEGGEEGAVLG
jgi:hypothetical protein